MRHNLHSYSALLVALFLFYTGIGRPGGGCVHVEGAEPSGQPTYRIVINIPAFRLSLFAGDSFVKEYPIAVGKDVSPSRTGMCTVVRKVKNPTWYPPDGRPPVPPGPDNPIGSRWLGLSWPGYGIHGTNNPSSIGRAVTLGCIRMRDEDAQELYDTVPIGTPVEFVYRTIEVQPGDDPLGARIRVYRDIYGLGTNTDPHAKSALAASLPQPMPEVDEGALKAIVSAQKGEPEPVPWKVRVEVDGQLLQGAAQIEAGQVLIALRSIADALKFYVHWDSARAVARVNDIEIKGTTRSGRLYVSIGDLRSLFDAALFEWDPQILALAVSTHPSPAPAAEQAGAPEPAPAPPETVAPEPSQAPVPTPESEPVPPSTPL